MRFLLETHDLYWTKCIVFCSWLFSRNSKVLYKLGVGIIQLGKIEIKEDGR